jgi:hypothetical protein
MKSSLCWSLLSITYLSNSDGTLIQPIIDITMRTKRDPYSYRSIPLPFRGSVYTNIYQRQTITVAKVFNLTFRYIHDVLSINNTNFPNITGFY